MAGDDERIMGGLGTARRLQQEGGGAGHAQKRDAATQEARLQSGEAWDDFCDTLRDTGKWLLEAEQPEDPGVRAQGYRYLLGLLKVGITQAAELREREFPKFLRIEDSLGKWGAENADNHYLATHIDAQHAYRIRGERGSCKTFLIEVHEGFMQLGDTRIFANQTAEDLEISPDGRFEIVASVEKPREAQNWLPLDPDARQIVIRQYFGDWGREEPARFTIERIGGEGLSPAPLSAAAMAETLDDAANWMKVSAEFWGEWVPELRANHVPGEMAATRKYVGGADDIRYGNDYYYVDPDEALIVTLTPPDARYWGIQLCNPWFITPDYANRITSLNNDQLVIDGDGHCRVVISAQDPGVANWLDTEGASEGVVMVRYIWTNDNPLPSVERIPFGDLAERLPADTTRVSEAQRREQIAQRQRGVALRESVG